jgi:pimeloyl-ACP methyl ester carboxylesterase
MSRHIDQFELRTPEGRVSIPFSDTGQPGGVAAISVHGWGCSKGDFDPIAERLADEHRIITLTLPHEVSGSMERRLHAIDTLASRQGLGQYALIGHSRGGDDATEQGFRRPNTVVGIAGVAASFEMSDRYLTGLVANMPKDEFVYGNGYDMHVARLVGSQNAGLRKYGHHVAAFTEAERLAYHASAVESVARARAGGSLYQFLGFQGVKWYVHGEFERAAYLPTLQAHPEVTVTEIPGADHFPDIDNPEGYASVMRGFMRAVNLAAK